MSYLDNDLEEEFSETALPQLNLLYRVALRLTRDEKDAEDLVQETFLKAFRAFETFKKGTNIKAWLITIMRNTYFNIYSKKTRLPSNVSFENAEINFNPEQFPNRVADSAEDEILKKLTSEKIRQEIDKLPDIFRIPVYLVDIEGFSYSDAAQILSIPIGTIMSRLHRGRKTLANSILSKAESLQESLEDFDLYYEQI